jgi:hypothetical protein
LYPIGYRKTLQIVESLLAGQRCAAGAALTHGAVTNVEGERISEELKLDAAAKARGWAGGIRFTGKP